MNKLGRKTLLGKQREKKRKDKKNLKVMKKLNGCGKETK